MIRPVEIALVGCGAIAQRGYLPALADVQEVRCLWVVDVRKELAESVARKFKIPNATDAYLPTLDVVDAVVLAVPNHLHVPMVLEALHRGKPVLCEKPLGRTVQEIRNMAAASEGTGVPLATGMIMRHYPALRELQAAVPWNIFGKVQGIRATYGIPLDWPVSNLSFFDKGMSGGGVWLDLGVHVIDLLFWVLSLNGVTVIDYRDDGESGMESEARASLVVHLPDHKEVPCRIEVSRLRRLANQIEVQGERASLVVPLSSSSAPYIMDQGGSRSSLGAVGTPHNANCFGEQLKAFAGMIRGLDSSCADGNGQMRVLEVVESCYRARQPLSFVWDTYEPWVAR